MKPSFPSGRDDFFVLHGGGDGGEEGGCSNFERCSRSRSRQPCQEAQRQPRQVEHCGSSRPLEDSQCGKKSHCTPMKDFDEPKMPSNVSPADANLIKMAGLNYITDSDTNSDASFCCGSEKNSVISNHHLGLIGGQQQQSMTHQQKNYSSSSTTLSSVFVTPSSRSMLAAPSSSKIVSSEFTASTSSASASTSMQSTPFSCATSTSLSNDSEHVVMDNDIMSTTTLETASSDTAWAELMGQILQQKPAIINLSKSSTTASTSSLTSLSPSSLTCTLSLWGDIISTNNNTDDSKNSAQFTPSPITTATAMIDGTDYTDNDNAHDDGENHNECISNVVERRENEVVAITQQEEEEEEEEEAIFGRQRHQQCQQPHHRQQQQSEEWVPTNSVAKLLLKYQLMQHQLQQLHQSQQQHQPQHHHCTNHHATTSSGWKTIIHCTTKLQSGSGSATTTISHESFGPETKSGIGSITSNSCQDDKSILMLQSLRSSAMKSMERRLQLQYYNDMDHWTSSPLPSPTIVLQNNIKCHQYSNGWALQSTPSNHYNDDDNNDDNVVRQLFKNDTTNNKESTKIDCDYNQNIQLESSSPSSPLSSPSPLSSSLNSQEDDDYCTTTLPTNETSPDNNTISTSEDDCSTIQQHCDRDFFHNEAANTLIRQVETKQLDLNIVLSKVDSYYNRPICSCRLSLLSQQEQQQHQQQQQHQHHRHNEQNQQQQLQQQKHRHQIQESSMAKNNFNDGNTTTIDDNDYFVEVIHGSSTTKLTTMKDNFSNKENCHQPQQHHPTLILTDDPQFAFRAARDALARDGKPDITTLDPKKQIQMQQTMIPAPTLHNDNSTPNCLNAEKIGETNSLILSNEGDHRLGEKRSKSQSAQGIIEGWLRKQTRRGRWAKRWFCLDSAGFHYSHSPPSSTNSSGSKKLTKIANTTSFYIQQSDINPIEFELRRVVNKDNSAIVTLRAQNEVEVQLWIHAITLALERQQLVDDIVEGANTKNTFPSNSPTIAHNEALRLNEGKGESENCSEETNKSPKITRSQTFIENYNNFFESASANSIPLPSGRLNRQTLERCHSWSSSSVLAPMKASVKTRKEAEEDLKSFAKVQEPAIPSTSFSTSQLVPSRKSSDLNSSAKLPTHERPVNIADIAVESRKNNDAEPSALVSIGDLLGARPKMKPVEPSIKLDDNENTSNYGKPSAPVSIGDLLGARSNMKSVDVPNNANASNDDKPSGPVSIGDLLGARAKMKSVESRKNNDAEPSAPVSIGDLLGARAKMKPVEPSIKVGVNSNAFNDDEPSAPVSIGDLLGARFKMKSVESSIKVDDDSNASNDDKPSAPVSIGDLLGARAKMKSIESSMNNETEPSAPVSIGDLLGARAKMKSVESSIKVDDNVNTFNYGKPSAPVSIGDLLGARAKMKPVESLNKNDDIEIPSSDCKPSGPISIGDLLGSTGKMKSVQSSVKSIVDADASKNDKPSGYVSIADLLVSRAESSSRRDEECVTAYMNQSVMDTDPALKDDPKYSKYFKMLKMGLPKGAVKNAIQRDELDPSIMDLDHNKSVVSQLKKEEEVDTGPPLKDDPKYSKYFKMIKMQLPMGAVKNAMLRDQLDPSIMDLDHNKSVASQIKAEEEENEEKVDIGPLLKDDPKYSKYFKMLKMGLPKESVKHAMSRDNLDPSVLDLDQSKSVESQLKKETKGDAGPILRDDPVYQKYFKMIKMGLPTGAVKNALLRDGHDPGILDLDHDAPLASQIEPKTESGSRSKKSKPKMRRKKVYWNALIDVKKESIWSLLQNSTEQIELKHDVTQFESLFTQIIGQDAAINKNQERQESTTSKSKCVKVIDAKRGMNGDIILRKLKMLPAQVAAMIQHMNVDFDRVDAAMLGSLLELLPTDEEAAGLASYLASTKSRDDALSEMTPCEQYMVAMKDVNDSEKRFRCIIFMAEFKQKMKDMKWDIDNLGNACEELKSSKRLQSLLAIVLKLVNEINTGGQGNMAAGFTLDTLSKLSETKAFDNKTTVLHYLVRVIYQTSKDVLNFQADIKSVVLAKGVLVERIQSTIKQMLEVVKLVKEVATKDGDSYRDPGEPNDEQASFRALHQLKVFLSDEDINEKMPMESTHFERFGRFAELELQLASDAINDSHHKYIGVLEFFGEDTALQCNDFFGTIDHFMEAFDHVEKEEQEKLKKIRRDLAKKAKLKVKSATKSAAPVLAVASMLKGIKKECDAAENPPTHSRSNSLPTTNPAGGIAAMTAQAALAKRNSTKQIGKENAPLLNTPARDKSTTAGRVASPKRKSTNEPEKKDPSEFKSSTSVIADKAAHTAFARRNPTKKREENDSPSTTAPAGNIAAMAAKDALAKRNSAKHHEEKEDIPPNTLGKGIAAMAAQASLAKRNSTTHHAKEYTPPSNFPVSAIAAATAKAALAKQNPTKNLQEEESSVLNTLIGEKAAALTKRNSTKQIEKEVALSSNTLVIEEVVSHPKNARKSQDFEPLLSNPRMNQDKILCTNTSLANIDGLLAAKAALTKHIGTRQLDAPA